MKQAHALSAGLVAIALGITISSGARSYTLPASKPLNSICRESGLSSLKIKRKQFEFNLPNLCEQEESTLAPEALSVIRQIGAVHARVAQYLGLSIAQMLPHGAPVLIRAVPAGALDSYFDITGVIGLGVFSDWKGEPVNESIYVHELGHLLSLTPNPSLPPILEKLAQQALLVETVADLITLGVTGRLFTQSFDVPQCMWKVRQITEYQSYNQPKQYFETTFAKARVLSCCRQLTKRGLHDSHTKPMCDAAPKRFPEINGLPYVFNRSRKFDPKDYLDGNGHFDTHRIGVPFNSCLKAAQNRLGADVRKIVFDSLWSASASGTQVRFLCNRAGAAGVTPGISVDVDSIEPVVKQIFSRLSALDEARFSALWKKHGMDKFMIMAKGEAAKEAAERARRSIDDQIAAAEASKQEELKHSACFDSYTGRLSLTRPECARVACQVVSP